MNRFRPYFLWFIKSPKSSVKFNISSFWVCFQFMDDSEHMRILCSKCTKDLSLFNVKEISNVKKQMYLRLETRTQIQNCKRILNSLHEKRTKMGEGVPVENLQIFYFRVEWERYSSCLILNHRQQDSRHWNCLVFSSLDQHIKESKFSTLEINDHHFL